MIFDVRNETARGYMLLGVFYIHALYALIATVPDPQHNAVFSFVQVKLLAPHVSVFFFLSGMASRGIGRRTVKSVAQQSLMLVFLAWTSHALGVVFGTLFYAEHHTVGGFVRGVLKPIVYGTGDSTYIAWFFTVLAAARLFAWLFERHRIVFLVAVVLVVAAIEAAKWLHLPDNIYEWRNWPAATLFFLMGTRVPKNWQVPRYMGLGGLFGTVILTWFNQPDLWRTGPCLACNIEFVSQPMVGQYGSLPVYFVQEVLFFLFLLWAAQVMRPAWPGRLARYFGLNSMQYLLLHGWVITALYPGMTRLFPARENALLLVALLVVNPAVHAALFLVLRVPLNKVIALCFEAARRVAEAPGRLGLAKETKPARRA